MKIVNKIVLRNCSHKLRVRYHLNTPFHERDLERFAEARIYINEFSSNTSVAKDQFVVEKVGAYHMTGLLGERDLIATYEKTGNDLQYLVLALEAKLLDRPKNGSNGPTDT